MSLLQNSSFLELKLWQLELGTEGIPVGIPGTGEAIPEADEGQTSCAAAGEEQEQFEVEEVVGGQDVVLPSSVRACAGQTGGNGQGLS